MLKLNQQKCLGVFRLNIVKRMLATVSNQNVQSQIVIPKAIKRGPTDILKALASTVQADHTGPHYKYIDDPYLTPVNNFDKRSNSLSKESGKKAAQYFIDNYPEYFYRDISEPKIEAFTYKEIYDESMEFEEMDLQKCIARCDVSNAIICYNYLIKQDIQISEKSFEDFFELVCFYNSENAPTHYEEEHWFKRNRRFFNDASKWNDNGFAEQLFNNMKIKTDKAYSALIQGMANYNQFERAFALYHQALESNMKLNTETYNKLIEISYQSKDSNDDRWELITQILTTMRNNEIKPNLLTLNNVLRQISIYKFWDRNSDLSRKVLNEFAFKFDIQPSLATYYHLLNVFYKTKYSRSPVIYEIVEKLQNEKFTFKDKNDVNFFSTAMDIAFNLNDIQLAYKIHSLASENMKFLVSNSNQNNYYNRFLKLICSSETIENFMDFYQKIVPHFYVPSIDLVEQILKTVHSYKALKYAPQIYDDLSLFSYMNRMELVEQLLAILDGIKPKDPLLVTFNGIVLDIFNKTNFRITRNAERGYSKALQWTAKSLSYCISILVKAQNITSAFEILQKLDSLKNEIFDQPENQALIDFIRYAMELKKYNFSLFCLGYCKETGNFSVIATVMKDIDINSLPSNIKLAFESFKMENEKKD